jgi:hypothetical protein
MTTPSMREALAELVACDELRRNMRADMTEQSYKAARARSDAAWANARATLAAQPPVVGPLRKGIQRLRHSAHDRFTVEEDQLLVDVFHALAAQPAAEPVAQAVAAERERCAQLCELWDATHPHRLAEEIRKAAPPAAAPQVTGERAQVPDCPQCHGEGTVRSMTSHLGPDDYEFDEQCSSCSGTGSSDIRDAINSLGYWTQKTPAAGDRIVVERAKVLQIIEARAALASRGAPPAAAPQVTGEMVLPEITQDDIELLHYNPNTDDILQWVRNYAMRALASRVAPPAAVPSEPVAWADEVEQRLHSWRHRMMNRDGDRVSLSDYMSDEDIDDLIDYVCAPLASAPTAGKPLPGADLAADMRAKLDSELAKGKP